MESLVEADAIEFGSAWIAKKSDLVFKHTEDSTPALELASDEHNSFDSNGSSNDVNFSSTCLASDGNGVLPNTPGVSQQTAELVQAASFISEIDDASQPSEEWKWEYIDDDTKIFRWVLEKDKNQSIIQYLSEVFSSKSVVILVSDKQRVSEIADVLSSEGSG